MGRLMQVLALLVLLIAAVAGSRFSSHESSSYASEDLTAGVADTSKKDRESEDLEHHRKGTEGSHVTGTRPGNIVLQDTELRHAAPLDAEPVDAASLDAKPLDAVPLDAVPLDAAPLNDAFLDAAPLDAKPLDAEFLDAAHLDTGLLDAQSGSEAEDKNLSDISEGAATEDAWTAYDNSAILVRPNSTSTISVVEEERNKNNEEMDDVDADTTSGSNATFWEDGFRESEAVTIRTDYGLGPYYGTGLYNATAATLAQQFNNQQAKLQSEIDIKLTREQRMTSAEEVTAKVVKMNRLNNKVGRHKSKRRGRFVLVRRNTTTQPPTNDAVSATQPNKIVFENNVLLGTEDYLKLDAVDLMSTEPQNSLLMSATRPSLRLDLFSETQQSAHKPGDYRLMKPKPSSADYRGAEGPLKHGGIYSAKTSSLGKSLQSSVTETTLRHSNWLSPTVSTHGFDYLPTALSPPHSALQPTAAPVGHWDLAPPSTVAPRHYSEVYDTNNILVSGRTFFFQGKKPGSKPQEISSEIITLKPSVVTSGGSSNLPLALGIEQNMESTTEKPQESLQEVVINEPNNRLPRKVFSTTNNDRFRDDSFERHHQRSKDDGDDGRTSVVAKPVTNTLVGKEGKRHKKRRTRFHTVTKNDALSDQRDAFFSHVGEESNIQKENGEEAGESKGTGKRLFRSSYLLPPPPRVGLLVRPQLRPRQYWTHPLPAPSYPPPPPPQPRPTPYHLSDGFSDGYPASYDYGYGVADDYRGTYFGHVEKRDGVLTEGKYFVDLPDGRRMIVTYYADHTGYHPTVTYEPRPTQTVQEDQFHGTASYPDQYPSPGPVNTYLANRNGLAPLYPAPFPHVHYVISHRSSPNYAFSRPYGGPRPSYDSYPNSINDFQPSFDPNRNYFSDHQNNNIGSFFPSRRPFRPEDSQSPYTPISSNGGGQFAPNFPIFMSTNAPLSSGANRLPHGNKDQPSFVSNRPPVEFTLGAVSPTIINRGVGNDNFRPIFVPNDNRHFLNERQALHDQLVESDNYQSEGPSDPALTSIEEHIANLHGEQPSAPASINNKPVFRINTKKKFTTRNADGTDDTVNNT